MEAFVCSAAFGDLRGLDAWPKDVAERTKRRSKGDPQLRVVTQPNAPSKRPFADGTTLHIRADGMSELLTDGKRPGSLRSLLDRDGIGPDKLKAQNRRRLLQTHTIALSSNVGLERPAPLPTDDHRRRAGGPLRSVDRMWSPGRPLRVSFPPDTKKSVAEGILTVAREWTENANTAFIHAGDHHGFPHGYPASEIRIAFDIRRRASLVGRSGAPLSLFRPTMLLSGIDKLDPESNEFRHIVLHEFGHALGLLHAHQSPDADLEWNVESILRHAKEEGWGWDGDDVARNVTTPAPANEVMWGRYDTASVMHYDLPDDWVIPQQDFQLNSELSEIDKDFIRAMYPFPDDPRQVVDIPVGTLVDGQLERRTSQIYRTTSLGAEETGFKVLLERNAKAVADLVNADGDLLATVVAPHEKTLVTGDSAAGDALFLWVTRVGVQGQTDYQVRALG